jgi:hypothetical protein
VSRLGTTTKKLRVKVHATKVSSVFSYGLGSERWSWTIRRRTRGISPRYVIEKLCTLLKDREKGFLWNEFAELSDFSITKSPFSSFSLATVRCIDSRKF